VYAQAWEGGAYNPAALTVVLHVAPPPDLAASLAGEPCEAEVGLGHIVALHYRSSTLYQVR
jgi:hypothetical protein